MKLVGGPSQHVDRKRRIRLIFTDSKRRICFQRPNFQKGIPHLVGIKQDAFEYFLSGPELSLGSLYPAYLKESLLTFLFRPRGLESLGSPREIKDLIGGIA